MPHISIALPFRKLRELAASLDVVDAEVDDRFGPRPSGRDEGEWSFHMPEISRFFGIVIQMYY
jgi:hypothetical protein